jgi:hypothetical protein
LLQFAIENGPVEIVDLPINSMVVFHSYVSLPEGRCLWDFVRVTIGEDAISWKIGTPPVPIGSCVPVTVSSLG